MRANLFAEALGSSDAPPPAEGANFSAKDRSNLEIMRNVPVRQSGAVWQSWFSSFFAVSRAMIPAGGAPALEQFLRSSRVADALSGAPPEIRAKVAFLDLVARRDLDGIRRDGPGLVAGPMQTLDPGFYAYVVVATATACLAGNPDASCRRVIALLGALPRGGPEIDVLRAHQSALP